MNDLGKAFIEFRNKYWNICENHKECKKCPLSAEYKMCSLSGLTEEEIETVERWTPPITRYTPRDTPVLVRDYDDEMWRKGFLCAKLTDGVVVYTNTENGTYVMCDSTEANSVRRFKQCELQ